MSHTAGTKPYARYRHDEQAVHPEGQERDKMHMFRVTHTQRDGLFMDAASADRMAQMELCVSQRPEGSIVALRGTRPSLRLWVRTDMGASVPTTQFRVAGVAAETDHWRRVTADAQARTTVVESRLTTEMDA